MATATERWSPRQSTRGTTRTWKREFDVIEAANDLDVYLATLTSTDYPNPTGKVPVENEPHPLAATLKVKSLSVAWPGFGHAVLTVNYERPENGVSHDTEETDPLDEPTRWRWERSITQELFDMDYYGYPFINSAREQFQQGAPRDVVTRTLTATRNEAFYDVVLAETFENKVNSETWTIPGVVSVAAGKVKLATIVPTGDFTADAPFVEVQYRFDIRPDGWKTRILDEGFRGRVGEDQYMRIVHAESGKEVSRAVLLDGRGIPIDTEAFKPGNPTDSISFSFGVAPEGGPGANDTVEIEQAPSGRAYYLRWHQYGLADLNGLGL